jgi:RHS repeat-associated protein
VRRDAGSGQWLRKTGAAAFTGNPLADVSSTSYSYDKAGRLTGSTQSTSGSANSYPFLYTYYNDDSLASLAHPSGRTVTTCYDQDARVSWVDQTQGRGMCQSGGGGASAKAYTNISAYWPQGAPHTSLLGNQLTETTTYNDRLQMTGIQAGSLLALGFFFCPAGGTSCSTNNGNLQSQTISLNEPSTAQSAASQQTYGYDSVNRLTTVSEVPTAGSAFTGWSATNSYDGFGNRWETGSPSYTPGLLTPTGGIQFNPKTNQLVQQSTGAAMPPDAYDGSGNLHDDPALGQMTYDAQNRLQQYVYGGVTYNYSYDADGHRVTKAQAGSGTAITYVYDGAGQLAAEYSTAATTNWDSGTTYLTADHLGSTRLVTDSSGNPKHRFDYMPFGEDLASLRSSRVIPSYGSANFPTQKFTGKERDSESGNDYFMARYFSSSMGGFMSPDWSAKAEPVPYAKLDDPQSLNLYSYVRNNPLSRTDPDGHFWQELKNWWSYNHWVNNAGLENALAKDAQSALGTMNKQGVTVGDKSSGQAFSGLTNKQIMDGYHYVEGQLRLRQQGFDDSDDTIGGTIFKIRNGASGKGAADDIPSWAKGKVPKAGQNGKSWAKDLLEDKYGSGNYKTGPGSGTERRGTERRGTA